MEIGAKSKTLRGADLAYLRTMYEGNEPWPSIFVWLQRHGYTHTKDTIHHIANNQNPPWHRAKGVIPAIPVTRWTQAPRVRQDVVCLLDAHVPYHDAAFMEKVLGVAEAWGIRRAIMDEDAWDVGWLSWFERDPNIPASAEIRAWQDVSACLLDTFPDGIDIHAGNHGERIRRMVRNMPKDARDALDLIIEDKTPEEALYIKDDRIRLTPYHYVYVYDVLVGHPSATAMQVGTYVSETYNTDCVLGHTHYRSVTWDRSDRHIAVECGGCFDPKKLKYVSARLPARARGKQRQGAAIIKMGLDGHSHVYLLTPRTDFQAMKNLYPA